MVLTTDGVIFFHQFVQFMLTAKDGGTV